MKRDRQDIDILAYKVESFDSDSFAEDIVSFSKKSIILVFNQRGLRVKNKPLGCKIKDETLFFLRLKNQRLFYYLYPAIFLIDHFKIFKLFLFICLRYRVKIILIENTYAAVLGGIMKKLGLFAKVVYLPGDWLAGSKPIKGIFSYIGGDIVFPLFDYFACKLSDLTLDCTKLISEARYKYWGRKITNKEMLFQVRLKVKSKETGLNTKNNIVFIGSVRPDSGLELAIQSLDKLRNKRNVCLKIIGPPNTQSVSLDRFTSNLQVDRYVKFLGFMERGNLNEALSDCFCGINLLTDKDSYTSRTLPAKIFDYFQYLLPVVVSNNIGWIAAIIHANELGMVIDLNENSFIKAIENIYEKQGQYRKNIIKYISNFQGTNIKEILKSP